MRIRFATILLVLGLTTGWLWIAGTGAGYAGLVATTGPATSITRTSATLHGVALALNPRSAWAFQYGATGAYGGLTKGAKIGTGLSAVSARVTGLTPGTTYHFRLVVVQGSSLIPNDWTVGNEETFTTAPAVRYGAVALRSSRLAVGGDQLFVPLRCSGGICRGTIVLAARGPHGANVRCGSASVALRAGERATFESPIGAPCAGLLRAARHHSLRAALFGAFTGAAKPLAAPVTLARL